MNKETFLDIIETGLKTDYRPQWLKDMVPRATWHYYHALAILAKQTNPELIVELGTKAGTGALHFRYGSPTAKIITVDIAKPVYPRLTDKMNEKNIKSVVCDSTEYASQVKDGTVDILFIDANHIYESLIADITAWIPKMAPEGIVLFDDIHMDLIITRKLQLVAIYGKLGTNTNMTQAWDEIVKRHYGQTFEVPKLHSTYSFGVLLLP